MYTLTSQIFTNAVTQYAFGEPTAPAANIDDLVALLRLEESDTYLEGLLVSASQYAARYLNRTLITSIVNRLYDTARSRGLAMEYKEDNGLYLPYGPVQSIVFIKTIDRDGNMTEITNYYSDLVSEPARVMLRGASASREIASLVINYAAGYGATYAAVPRLIQQGILQHAAYMYEHRGDCGADEAAKLSGAHSMYGTYRTVIV